MRWYIAERKRKIAAENFEGHEDDIEMSGEKVSAIIGYAVKNAVLKISRRVIFPMIRLQPDVTQASYQITHDIGVVDFGGAEVFEKVEIDGVLSLYTHVGRIKIAHRFYPSVALPIFYEQVEIFNGENRDISPKWDTHRKIDGRIACEGWAYAEQGCDIPQRQLKAGETLILTFSFSARFANEKIPREKDSLRNRYTRVNELFSECDLTTDDETFDTMFAFAKLRVGESIFNTRKGRVHSPGGTNYYAAVWCNDQCEYSTPWFGFTGDKIEAEAAENAMRWYGAFMNDEYEPIPSSVISEGTDYWNDRRDRGDAAMYLYGNSRFFLEQGRLPDEEQTKLLSWCAEYTRRQITKEGVVFSDTDELEFRLSSGINLSTSSLAYGAFGYWAAILKRQGRREEAEEFLGKREEIRRGIEKYFGAEIAGYQTYRYHKGCEEIRAWNCLPVYMKIFDRAQGTANAIDEKLWREGSCLSTENENIMWDRSALYYIASLFRMGETERAWARLSEFSKLRLLGERVPYAVEAYPEYKMRHLSAESGLYCRIVTDGILNIDFDEAGFEMCPALPEAIRCFSLKNLLCDGVFRNIEISGGKVKVTSESARPIEFSLGEKKRFDRY